MWLAVDDYYCYMMVKIGIYKWCIERGREVVRYQRSPLRFPSRYHPWLFSFLFRGDFTVSEIQ